MAEFETTFADLGLKAPILEALNDLGYEKPSQFRQVYSTSAEWPRRSGYGPDGERKNCSILSTSAAES